jgi:formamidopyrimidine-DNA glycosylase
MPELPEVEVIRRGLAPLLVGRRFIAVTAGDKRLRQQSPLAQLRRWLPGRFIEKLRRRGKYLRFDLEGGVTLLIHLGMTGRLFAAAPPSPALDHVHLKFKLEGGLNLLYQDVRRFGQILVYPPGVPPAPLAAVGLEPFSRKLTPDWLLTQAQGRFRPLKNFLLDARLVAGIGNIYACEILFATSLHPATEVRRLTLADWDRVLAATRRILKHAIAKGGTTVSDYLNSRGETGLFQLELRVYGRAGERCCRCSALISRLVQAGRSSFFCPQCQKLK